MAAAQGQSLDLAFDKGLQLAFPAVMVQLLQALLDPEPSFLAISRLLKKDPMLAGKVLHVVNTVHYGFVDKITDINRAAVAMGTSDLFKLVISLSLQKRLNPTFEREPKHIFGDWRLTLWSAFAAEAIAMRLCPHQAGQAYLAGMLKDLQLYLAFCREDVPPFLRRSELATCPAPGQFAEEQAFWGSTHQDLGHAIFLYWGLPLEMAEAVRLHHDFDNAAAHPALTRCVIYATRWAELLHSPEADPGELVPFELALARQLGLDMQGMEEFREGLADKFSQLLSQLGIGRDNPDTRLYDKSLSSIQSFYFLALRAVSSLGPSLQQPMADTLRDQLRLFWSIESWDLWLQIMPNGGGVFFRCLDGDIEKKETASDFAPAVRKGWTSLPIQGAKRTYGFLAVPEMSQSAQLAPLPMFVHMFGMCMDEQRKQATQSSGCNDMKDIPFILARLDAEGAVVDATSTFLEAFAMDEVPVGLAARNLLEEQLGISPLRLGTSMDAHEVAQGDIVFAPEGRFPATPVYLARYAERGRDGGSYLLLGDVVRMSPIQSLVLIHQDFMDTLFDSIEAQVCLVDSKGVIIYCSPSVASLVGKNIFAVSRPESIPREAWHPSLLAGLDSSLSVEASVIVNGVLEAQELVFAPLAGSFRRGYLLTMRAAAVGPAPGKSRKLSLAARHRDPLTGLYGYSQFHMLLQQAVELTEKRKSEVGVIFCDIIGLHRINDEQGYAMGDAALRRTAEVVNEACRSGRDYPCRYGSDEFAVIVTGASNALMESLASGILERLNKGQGEAISLRMGLAILPRGISAREGLEMARNACREAAARGETLHWADQA